jgi:Fe2+ or Zn2+ uptake regulation protein
MSHKSDDDAQAVAAEIVRYLRQHAEAADTVEGVARWWLSRQRYEEAIATVERAMAMLVNRQMVEKHTLPDGTAVYRSGPLLARTEASRPNES